MTPDLIEDILAFVFVTQASKMNHCVTCGSDLKLDGTCFVCGDDSEYNEELTPNVGE